MSVTQQEVPHSVAEAPEPSMVRATVARVLLAALSDQCDRYCLLSGYDRMPDYFETDIDFLVSRSDFSRISSILAGVAVETGTNLCQFIDHEVTGRAYFLTAVSGSTLTIVQPDCASDYYHFGKKWLQADQVLAARRLHPNGFWIPSAAHEFAYCLIKRLNKSRFASHDGIRLHSLYHQDRAGCDRFLADFFSAPEASTIAAMAASGDWSRMGTSLPALRNNLMRGRRGSFLNSFASLPAKMLHTLSRITRPTGLWIAFIGPDGCGKSTVLRHVTHELAPAFRNGKTYHLRPRLIGRRNKSNGPVTDPHGLPPRGLLASVAKVFDLVADYLFGYIATLRPALIRSSLVVFDRCFCDLLLDSRRIRYGGPHWLLKLAARIIPQPDLILLLDAAPEVLWSRKREVPFEEVVRQRAAYLQLAHSLDNAVVVDAAKPADAVIHDALIAITQHLAERTRLRLHLTAIPDSSPLRQTGAPSEMRPREMRTGEIRTGETR
jgi:thymidylate kinase